MVNNDENQCSEHIKELISNFSAEDKETALNLVKKQQNKLSTLTAKCDKELSAIQAINPEYGEYVSMAAQIQNDPVSYSNKQKSLKALLFDISSDIQEDDSAKVIESTVTMFIQKAQEELDSAITSLKQSGMNYQTAIQLEKSGAHIENVQKKVSTHNQNILSNLSSDIMTAKRVATINQQNTIHANVVTEYMQLCCIFFAIAIVIMFLFSIGAVRSFFSHPFVVMQILLVLLFTILVIIIIYRVFMNNNHYWMLYQERVFPDMKEIDAVMDIMDKTCPDTTTTTPTQPAPATHPDVVDDTDESCDAE